LGISSTFVRVYQSNGTPITGAVAVFSATSTASGALQGIAMDGVGDFAVMYGKSTYSKWGWTTEAITVQRYTKTGAVNGSAISVVTPTLVDYSDRLGMDGSGNFVVAWDEITSSRGGSSGTAYVYAQCYTAAGKANGSRIIVAQNPASMTLDALAMNSAGRFVVAYSAMVQIYNADRTPAGAPLTLAADPETAALDNAGNVTVAWTDIRSPYYPDAYGQIHYRQLTAAGQLSPESIANTTTAGGQFGPGVTATGNGAFVVAWQGNGPGDNQGIFAQRFTPGPQIGSLTESASSVKAGSSVTFTASNLTDPNPGGSITQVAIYVDTTGDKQLEVGTDALLGYAILNSNGTWTFTFSTAGWAPGTYTLFAQAEDSLGVFSDPSALILTVT
jgi:hypothetical protein